MGKPIGPSQKEIDNFVAEAGNGNLKSSAELLKKFPDVINEPDKFGFTALMYAARIGDIDAIEALLKMGANVNGKNNIGCTALHTAAANGKTGAVATLLKNGASIEKTDVNGRTALTIAQNWDQKEVVTQLKKIQNEKDLTEDIADFSPALKRNMPATSPIRRPYKKGL